MRQQPITRLNAEGGEVVSGPVCIGLNRANRMNPPQKASHPFQYFGPVQLRRATTALGENRKPKILECVQRASVNDGRRHHWNLALVQRKHKLMLFQNLRIRPAIRPIKFGDNRLLIFDADLINAILVTVQRKQAAIAAITQTVNRIKNQIGAESRIGLC